MGNRIKLQDQERLDRGIFPGMIYYHPETEDLFIVTQITVPNQSGRRLQLTSLKDGCAWTTSSENVMDIFSDDFKGFVPYFGQVILNGPDDS